MGESPHVQLAHLGLTASEADAIGGREAKAALMVLTRMVQTLGRRAQDEGDGVVHGATRQCAAMCRASFAAPHAAVSATDIACAQVPPNRS